jgi:hypothetical protein
MISTQSFPFLLRYITGFEQVDLILKIAGSIHVLAALISLVVSGLLLHKAFLAVSTVFNTLAGIL